MKKQLKWLISGIVLVAAIAAFYMHNLDSKGIDQRKSVANFSAASFEYVNDTGYKLITSEIGALATFDSLLLKPSEEEFTEDWIYRITFHPKSIMPNDTEFAILFGEHSLSMNGKTYVAENGNYADILHWVSGKYEYFDYALQEWN
jgi:hypothetical protein